MVAALDDVLLIPYGVAEWSPEGVSLEALTARGLRLRTAFPCAAINRPVHEPLRFNNSRYEFGLVPEAQAGTSDERTVLKDYLKGLCRPWDNVSTRFLDAYFQVVSDVIEEQRSFLSERLAPFAGLYDYKDWFFSAPKPLPRAHLHAPPEGSAAGAIGGAAEFARVDFAFWLGDRIVAAQSPGSFLTPRKATEQADRLRMAGVEVVPFGPADLQGSKAGDFFQSLLGPSALSFWDDEALPAGPFRSSLLDGY